MRARLNESLLLVAVTLLLAPLRWRWHNVAMAKALEPAINPDFQDWKSVHSIAMLRNLRTIDTNPSLAPALPAQPSPPPTPTLKPSVQRITDNGFSKSGSDDESRRTRHSPRRKRRRTQYADLQSKFHVANTRARSRQSQKRDSDIDRSPEKMQEPNPTMIFGEDINYDFDFDNADVRLDQALNSTPTPAVYGRSMSSGQKVVVQHKKKKDIWLFFTLSLSFFATIGIVLFIRRCVKCPPSMSGGSGSGLRAGCRFDADKDLPPVEYSAIADTQQ